MGKREDNLRRILIGSGIIKGPILTVPSIRTIVRQDNFGECRGEVEKIFFDLGGKDDEIDFRGRWDIVGDKYIIELDEELHFNHYRLLTLGSSLYKHKTIKSFPIEAYVSFCHDYSERCISAGSFGRKWSTNHSVVMFGEAGVHGDLSGNGSPRWKQRAFYDFVKDISVLATGIPVVRLSIYDKIQYRGIHYMLGDVLNIDGELLEVASLVSALIDRRLPS